MSRSRKSSASSSSSQAAKPAVRFHVFSENLVEQTDLLVHASINEDWKEVGRLSEMIARASQAYGYGQISEQAWQIHEELSLPENSHGVKRRVVRLLEICGCIPPREEELSRAA